MESATDTIESFVNSEYKYGFVSDIETDSFAPGLNEDVVRRISEKKGEPEFMLEWRLKAFRHWLTMTEPHWPNVHYPPIDYQAYIYYAARQAEEKAEQPGRSGSGDGARCSKNWASRSMNKNASPMWLSMPFWIAPQWRQRSGRN